MGFLDKITAFLPFGKKEQNLEYFFAVNIGVEKLTAAAWTIEDRQLKILNTASESYLSADEIAPVTDKLLDQVLGLREIEPQKILFGVPSSWLVDDNLKDEYLGLLRSLVKKLELTPMAYVAQSHALIHFLEKQEGVPTTAILVGFEKLHLTVTVVRAGKLDGVKVVKRGESSGADIEKVLLTFTDVETLPSKILIYGTTTAQLKSQLSAFPWMSKLSFLHLPKIDTLRQDLEIKSVCLAGGSEIDNNVSYTEEKTADLAEQIPDKSEEVDSDLSGDESKIAVEEGETLQDKDNFGFVVGDVAEEADKTEMVTSTERSLEIDDFEKDLQQPPVPTETKYQPVFNFKRFIPTKLITLVLVGILGIGIILTGIYLFALKAQVKVYVEPKILEKDATVIADPNQKTVDENAKIIPGQIVEIEISGSAKDTASGKRQIGESAKGTVVIINNTASGKQFSAGTTLASSSGLKFKLDRSASVSATLTDSASKSTVTVSATAVGIGADGNIPSETKLTIGNFTVDQFIGKAQGNFSGGTSKDVTVVSNEDQQRLLAKLSSDLRLQAQQKLQEKYQSKKILEEALAENIIKKSYSKNTNDAAGEFSLNMTAKYKGTAFDDADLKTIVSKLVTIQVPDSFKLDLSATETQADISKLEKDGKLVFLARFKAKLLPKIDTDQLKNKIKFKTPLEAINILKGMENVLDSEIKLTPNLPLVLGRLPILSKNITIEAGLK